jgi:hypothetical protein
MTLSSQIIINPNLMIDHLLRPQGNVLTKYPVVFSMTWRKVHKLDQLLIKLMICHKTPKLILYIYIFLFKKTKVKKKTLLSIKR